MATVTVRQANPTFVVELDEAEALYLNHALRLTTPTREFDSPHGTGDPVFDALSDALEEAGVNRYDDTHAAVL